MAYSRTAMVAGTPGSPGKRGSAWSPSQLRLLLSIAVLAAPFLISLHGVCVLGFGAGGALAAVAAATTVNDWRGRLRM